MKSSYTIIINETHTFSGLKSPLSARARFLYWKEQDTIGFRKPPEKIKKVWLLKDGEIIEQWEKDAHAQSVQAG